jgi:hypothetical protein
MTVLTGTVNVNGRIVDRDDFVADDVLFNLFSEAMLVLVGADVLNGDTLAMSGQLRALGPVEIDNGLTLENAVTFVNASELTQNGGEALIGASSSDTVSIRNLPGATWDIEANASLVGAASAKFVNFGDFEQTGNQETNVIDVAFYDFGRIEAAGTLQFKGQTRLFGVVDGPGAVDVGDVALIGAKIGVATFDVSGTADVYGRVVCASDATFGEIVLHDGRLVLSGEASWGSESLGKSSDITGAGALIVTGSAAAGSFEMSGDISLINAGAITIGQQGDTGNVVTAGAAGPGNIVIRNLPGATWTDLGLREEFLPHSGSAEFVNLGTFVDSTRLYTGFSIPVVNYGLMEVAAPPLGGALIFDAPITGQGTIDIGGTYVFTNHVVGAGQTFVFNAPPPGGVDASLDIDDMLQFYGQISEFGVQDKIQVNTGAWAFKDFEPNAGGTGGLLVFTDGAAEKDIRMLGQYDPARFETSVTNVVTAITYAAA